MRVLIDTNLLINNLLSPNPANSATGLIFASALRGSFSLLLIPDVILELDRKLREDSSLASRLPREDADELVSLLESVAEDIPVVHEPYPQIGRDRKDDFLVAHAVVARADYLVSWDNDLLVLDEVLGVRMVNPPTLLQILRQQSLL